MANSRETEKIFIKHAKQAGFIVEKPRVITIAKPVENREGKIKKIKTVPDCFIIDPQTRNTMHIEITNGAGQNTHKMAQKRVVEAAGVKNYTVMTGNQIKELCKKISKEEKRIFLLTIFGWLSSL